MDAKVLTIPNVITIVRFAMVPGVVYLIVAGEWVMATILFALAAVSDAVDGIIARQWDQHSDLGAWLDPVADKALIIAASCTLAAVGLLPVWLVALIVLRDAAILGVVGLLGLVRRAPPIHPIALSKWNTGFQLVLAGWLLVSRAFGWPAEWLTQTLIGVVVVLTLLSSIGYGYKLWQHLHSVGVGVSRFAGQPDKTR